MTATGIKSTELFPHFEQFAIYNPDVFFSGVIPYFSPSDVLSLGSTCKKIQEWIHTKQGAWKTLLGVDFHDFRSWDHPKRAYQDQYFLNWALTKKIYLPTYCRIEYSRESKPNCIQIHDSIWGVDQAGTKRSISLEEKDGLLTCLTASEQLLENEGLVVAGFAGGTTRIWSMALPQLSIDLAAHSSQVTVLALSSDNKKLAIGFKDRMVEVWHLPDHLETRPRCILSFTEEIEKAEEPLCLAIACGNLFSGFSSSKFLNVRNLELAEQDLQMQKIFKLEKEKICRGSLASLGHMGNYLTYAYPINDTSQLMALYDYKNSEIIGHIYNRHWHELEASNNAAMIFLHPMGRIRHGAKTNCCFDYQNSYANILLGIADDQFYTVYHFDWVYAMPKAIRNAVYENLYKILNPDPDKDYYGVGEDAYKHQNRQNCTNQQKAQALINTAMQRMFTVLETRAELTCALSALFCLMEFISEERNNTDEATYNLYKEKCFAYFRQLPKDTKDAIFEILFQNIDPKAHYFPIGEDIFYDQNGQECPLTQKAQAIADYMGSSLNKDCAFNKILARDPVSLLTFLQ